MTHRSNAVGAPCSAPPAGGLIGEPTDEKERFSNILGEAEPPSFAP